MKKSIQNTPSSNTIKEKSDTSDTEQYSRISDNYIHQQEKYKKKFNIIFPSSSASEASSSSEVKITSNSNFKDISFKTKKKKKLLNQSYNCPDEKTKPFLLNDKNSNEEEEENENKEETEEDVVITLPEDYTSLSQDVAPVSVPDSINLYNGILYNCPLCPKNEDLEIPCMEYADCSEEALGNKKCDSDSVKKCSKNSNNNCYFWKEEENCNDNYKRCDSRIVECGRCITDYSIPQGSNECILEGTPANCGGVTCSGLDAQCNIDVCI